MKSKIHEHKKNNIIKVCKKLLLILVAFATLHSCNNDDDATISAINGFIGEWTLQSRIANNATPLEIDNEKLLFTEDSNLSDFSGNYEFIATSSSSGVFIIDVYNVMIFTSDNGNSIPYDFEINNATLKLSYEGDNGDVISEVWIKDY